MFKNCQKSSEIAKNHQKWSKLAKIKKIIKIEVMHCLQQGQMTSTVICNQKHVQKLSKIFKISQNDKKAMGTKWVSFTKL